jgi:hypothetical protein
VLHILVGGEGRMLRLALAGYIDQKRTHCSGDGLFQLIESESSSNAGGNGIGAPFGLWEGKRTPRGGAFGSSAMCEARIAAGFSQQKTRRGFPPGRNSSVSISQLALVW